MRPRTFQHVTTLNWVCFSNYIILDPAHAAVYIWNLKLVIFSLSFEILDFVDSSIQNALCNVPTDNSRF